MIKFAELEIYVSGENEVVLKQFCFGEDDQIVAFPKHQAAAICKAIKAVANSIEDHKVTPVLHIPDARR